MAWDEEVTAQAGAEAIATTSAELSLVHVHGPGLSSAVTMPLLDALVIGRAREPGVYAIPDARISRKHVRLVPEGDRVRVEDTSTNGTFVMGARVQRAIATDGDVIRTGDSLFVVRLRARGAIDASVAALLGTAPSMQRLRGAIGTVAPHDVPILVLGESGTGKELVARALHDTSGRSGAFVALNCGAIPEALAESQLFGHVAGAFTGARSDFPGVLRQAHGGTLFLDEIGEMPLAIQAKLLRALEERAVTPVGSTKTFAAQATIVAATHRDLRTAVDEGRFRGDLYSRLAGVVLRTPPLRERREDVLALVERTLGRSTSELDADLAEALLLHPWPFNVRELIRVATELRIRAAEGPLTLATIVDRLDVPALSARRVAVSTATTMESEAVVLVAPTIAPSPPAIVAPLRKKKSRPQRPPPDRAELAGLVEEHGTNVSRIARALGYSRRQTRRFLITFGWMSEDDAHE
ncbi:sigma 54-interacting transcriptional regulator [Sandaracinus amylolyticus]|uniref:Response regulator of zinc sigma-54-dependent two-component system n=1 Tax=Sandaracinus amylolyticus TaxID=927083 RepID=A0A0F6VZP0_9BACT|nr:sigma 54-interacting transcriptional regulator [Sandaracinus amylolyticus]AKF03723.1 Response regulator of zinc sigma-54-dependent two-component system [Sandaracinus amylolyticus]